MYSDKDFTQAYEAKERIDSEYGSLTNFVDGMFTDTELSYKRTLAKFENEVDGNSAVAKILIGWFFEQYA